MNARRHLQQARADLAALEGDTGKLEENVRAQEAALDTARRSARSGAGTFEAVVEQQARQEAARGMLAQHLQDVADLSALVDELNAAATASGLLEEGRDAYRAMRAAEQAHAQRAAQAETQLRTALDELEALSQQRSQARARLAAAARQTVSSEHGRPGTPWRLGEPLTARQTPERTTAAAFLAQIDPELKEHEVFSPGGELALPGHLWPLLAGATTRQ